MKNVVDRLLTVKSLVTLVVTVVFAVLALKQQISSEQFMQVFVVIIAFYFGTQNMKTSNKIKDLEDNQKVEPKAQVTEPPKAVEPVKMTESIEPMAETAKKLATMPIAPVAKPVATQVSQPVVTPMDMKFPTENPGVGPGGVTNADCGCNEPVRPYSIGPGTPASPDAESCNVPTEPKVEEEKPEVEDVK